MKKILITGGAGFIGSHANRYFADKGFEVHVIDNLMTGKKSNVSIKAVFHECDIRDGRMRQIIKEINAEVIIHLAAQINVRKSNDNPKEDIDININGLVNILEAAKVTGLKQFIFTSSGGAIYGNPKYLPIKETHPKNPESIYGMSKLASEFIIKNYAIRHGFKALILRLANMYGPGQDPSNEAGVNAIFIKSILSGKIPTIFGDGEQTRDFVYVEDLINYFRDAINNATEGTFNVGTGSAISINELYKIIAHNLNCADAPLYGPENIGEVRHSALSNNKLVAQFGHAPEVPIHEGIKRMIKWFQ